MTNTEQAVGATPETLYKRKIAMIILGGVFLAIALLWIIYWLIWGRFAEETDNAYVNGNIVQLMPQVPGTVIEVRTDDTQLVTEGQVIIKLDKTDYAIALQHAQAELGQAVRQVRQYFENAAQAKQKVRLDKASLMEARQDLERRQGLTGNRAVSGEEMLRFTTGYEAAEAKYKISVYQMDAATALIANTQLYTHPLVESAKANLKKAYLNYQRTTIRAPVTGYIAKRNVQPGQQVAMNSAMLAIIPLNDTWVDANYKESSLNDLRANQPVTLYADAYPEVTYHGTVMGLNAGTGAVFSLLPPQNATGNWIKIVQRIPVRVALDPEELKKNPLQLGLSMRAIISTKNRDGSRMQNIINKPYERKTTIYEKQLADVDALINKILRANSEEQTQAKAEAYG